MESFVVTAFLVKKQPRDLASLNSLCVAVEANEKSCKAHTLIFSSPNNLSLH